MSARSEILAKVKGAAAGAGSAEARAKAVDERLSHHAAGVSPGRGQLEPAARTDLFQEEAERVSARVTRLASYADLPEAVSDYLRASNLPQTVRRGDDARLAGAPWDRAPSLEVATGPTDGTDLACLSHALAGVAETGTLVLASGGDNPTTLNFLPEHHIVVVAASDIAGDFEAAFAAVRARYGEAAMPRTVNFVTGPSRSADIEQTLLLGAHGPRQLQIFVVEA